MYSLQLWFVLVKPGGGAFIPHINLHALEVPCTWGKRNFFVVEKEDPWCQVVAFNHTIVYHIKPPLAFISLLKRKAKALLLTWISLKSDHVLQAREPHEIKNPY